MIIRWRWPLACFVFVLLLSSFEAHAQDEPEEELAPRLPFAVITVKNLDQSLVNIGKMFDASGRSDMMELIEGFLTDRAGNLDGIDRARPFGQMFYLSQTLPPRPIMVTYIPVDDLDAFIRTVSLGPAKPEKVDGKENVYRFPFGRRQGGPQMVIRDGWALSSFDADILEEELPDPASIVTGLAARYDLSVSGQLKNIPPLMKEFFITALNANAQAELQQRDDESKAAHMMRKASGQSTLDLMTQVLRDGEQITLGLQALPEERIAAIELNIDAVPESEFSEFVKNIGGRKSAFMPLENDSNPLTMTVSWVMDRREKEMVAGLIDGMELELTERLPESTASSIQKIADSLRATAEQEHINAVFQFVPIEKDVFCLIGGLKLVGAETFSANLRNVLSEIGELEGIDNVELDVHQHQNVNFHRLVGTEARDEDIRVYGGPPNVYLGAGNGIFWFGIGADDVLAEIDFAIDLMLETPPGTLEGSSAPFQVVFRMLPWLQLPPENDEDVLGRELAQEAMDSGDDAVRIDIRPTETGARIRMQFEEGFVRLLGLALATQYDRSQL